MIVNGWRLFQHPLFESQLRRLLERVEKLAAHDPDGYLQYPAAKLLTSIHRYTREVIPANLSAPEFRQGDTLGPDNRHWFRAKFHGRFRLFFRFSTEKKVIVYAWVNDESSLRKAGSKTDPYAIFRAMLESGEPPQSLDALLLRAVEFKDEG